ncbi:MAG: hypothetical protein ACTH9T_09340 [Mycetocola reblochoni]|uniref:hypothetical protein n=1 Tax=Mycetocola reblochoni TaxID=331618 RepID=UPI0011811F0D|nr:hypothetical protein [Mycetocola reblochoni]
MALFRRRRKREYGVGTFVAPEPVRPASEDELVAEGVMIAGYAVRMAVKNQIIVSALEDRADFDRRTAIETAVAELRLLAAENRDSSARIESARVTATGQHGRPRHQHDYQMRDSIALSTRRAVYDSLAERLTALSEDEDFLSGMVDQAKTEAWEEVGATIEARLPDNTPGAVRTRDDDEVARVIAQDLAALSKVRAAQRRRRQSRPQGGD